MNRRIKIDPTPTQFPIHDQSEYRVYWTYGRSNMILFLHVLHRETGIRSVTCTGKTYGEPYPQELLMKEVELLKQIVKTTVQCERELNAT